MNGSRGISIHIGLNRIDPEHYGTDGQLAGCENDARAMQRLAAALGYETSLLLTTSATAQAVLAAVRSAAERLQSGDVLLVTYAGHGAQVEDVDADEADANDETWCAYDRMIVDDELYALWAAVAADALILVVSDSCHSGTVARMVAHVRDLGTIPRQLAQAIAQKTYDGHRSLYQALQRAQPVIERSKLPAALIQLSACRDDQLAADGDGNGLFTEKLLQAWNAGGFTGSYTDFVSTVRQLMPFPTAQTPGYDSNPAAAQLLDKRPFEISAALPAAPTASCPCKCTTDFTPTKPLEETSMQALVVDNGNWDDVSAALSQELGRTRGGGGASFIQDVIAANASAAQAALLGNGAGGQPLAAARGGSVFRTFWWGCHVQMAPEDLRFLYTATDPNGPIATFLRQVIPATYQWLVALISGFVVVSTQVLRAADRGRGVYISMSWFAPGVLVPTTV